MNPSNKKSEGVVPTTYEFKSFWTGVIGVVAEYDPDDESIIE